LGKAATFYGIYKQSVMGRDPELCNGHSWYGTRGDNPRSSWL